MRALILLLLCMPLAACITTPERSADMRESLVVKLVDVSTSVCQENVAKDETLMGTLDSLNNPAKNYCRCVYETLFDNMTPQVVDRFLDESVDDNVDGLLARQPWRDRVLEASLTCLASPPTAELNHSDVSF